MSKTNKKKHRKTVKANMCTFKLDKPSKKKGTFCGSPCKSGNRCPMHTSCCMQYRQLRCSNLRYDSLIKKTNEVLSNQKSVLRSLEEKRDMNQRKLNGINMFLGVRNKEARPNYILYIDNHKHNAMSRKATLETRNALLKKNIAKLEEHITILKKIKKLFSNN